MIAYVLDEPECIRAAIAVAKRRQSRRKIYLGMGGPTAVNLALGGLFRASDGDWHEARYFVWAGMAAAIVLPLAWMLDRFILLPRRTRRLLRKSGFRPEPTAVSWDDQGLTWRVGDAEGITPWSDLHEWRETTESIVLLPCPICFIPKRAFESPKESEDFSALLAQRAATASSITDAQVSTSARS